MHSTRSGGGDFDSSVSLQGKWAGDGVAICTLEEGLANYRVTSNKETSMNCYF